MNTKNLDEFVEAHKDEQGPLISILHAVQKKEGYVPEEVIYHLSSPWAKSSA